MKKRRHGFGVLLVLIAGLTLGGVPAEQAAAAPAEGMRLVSLTSSVAALDLTRAEPGAMAEHAMRQPSIATLRRVGRDHYRTSVGQEIRLAAGVTPRRLAPALEWRILAHRRLLAVRQGAEIQLAFDRPGTYTVEVGGRRLLFDIYRTVLTSHVSGSDTVAAGVPVTFTAVTEPPGFEREITWLASGGDGTARPAVGRGPSFTVTFRRSPDGRLGVKADNAAFTQSPELSGGTTAIEISQVDATLDATTVVDSDWGSADLTFVGSPALQYFNLSLDGFWAVQNMPVLSNEGDGVIQTQTFNFALGVPSGTPVSTVGYGLELSTAVRTGPPPVTATAAVGDRTVVIATGEEGENLFQTPAQPAIGSAAFVLTLRDRVDEVRKRRKPAFNSGVPNQEVGENECVPGAISNSLKFLQMQGLKLPDDKISIDAMKPATGWTPAGAPTGDNPWWQRKDKYMQDNGLPVTTTTSTNFADALAALDKHCDIELRVPGHAAVVTGIVPLANGDYGIIIQHDTEQGKPGGTKSEVVIYKASDGTLWDGWSVNGKTFDRFVIECPKT
jgi:hypothetical protein